jgi:hypothetical protein
VLVVRVLNLVLFLLSLCSSTVEGQRYMSAHFVALRGLNFSDH